MKSYKTTITGALVAGLYAFQNYNGNGGKIGYAIAVAIAIFGALSKDFDQTHAQ
jgi:hypothetical protein